MLDGCVQHGGTVMWAPSELKLIASILKVIKVTGSEC